MRLDASLKTIKGGENFSSKTNLFLLSQVNPIENLTKDPQYHP
jgi:hypothetical protein